jgi:hypothetical protein
MTLERRPLPYKRSLWNRHCDDHHVYPFISHSSTMYLALENPLLVRRDHSATIKSLVTSPLFRKASRKHQPCPIRSVPHKCDLYKMAVSTAEARSRGDHVGRFPSSKEEDNLPRREICREAVDMLMPEISNNFFRHYLFRRVSELRWILPTMSEA